MNQCSSNHKPYPCSHCSEIRIAYFARDKNAGFGKSSCAVGTVDNARKFRIRPHKALQAEIKRLGDAVFIVPCVHYLRCLVVAFGRKLAALFIGELCKNFRLCKHCFKIVQPQAGISVELALIVELVCLVEIDKNRSRILSRGKQLKSVIILFDNVESFQH